jgi:hypothetical protein
MHTDIPVLKAIVDLYLPDLLGLVITRSDVIDLEQAVTFEAANAQEAVIKVGQMLTQWHEERVLRPERVAMKRRALARTPLRASSRQRAVRAEKPAWQRTGGLRGLMTPQQMARRSPRGMLPRGMAQQSEQYQRRHAPARLNGHIV